MNFFLAIFFLICAVTSASILHPTERQAGCARCKLGTKCVGSGIDARCVLPKSIGGLCGMDSYSICSSGLLCENGRCVQYMSAGGPCKTPQQICKSGLVCNSIQTCSPPLTIALLGESCKNPLVSKCETGLRCRAGICTQPGLQGQPCNNPGVICESKTSCVGPTGSKSCKIISGVGQTCADASMYDCDKNACDGSICTKIISKGSSCWGKPVSPCLNSIVPIRSSAMVKYARGQFRSAILAKVLGWSVIQEAPVSAASALKPARLSQASEKFVLI